MFAKLMQDTFPVACPLQMVAAENSDCVSMVVGQELEAGFGAEVVRRSLVSSCLLGSSFPARLRKSSSLFLPARRTALALFEVRTQAIEFNHGGRQGTSLIFGSEL